MKQLITVDATSLEKRLLDVQAVIAKILTDLKAKPVTKPAQPVAEPTLFGDLPGGDAVPYAQIVANFNVACISLPKCSQLSPARREAIKARWTEAGKPVDAFISLFQRVEESDFLTGRVSTFRASFDWIMKPANFIKIREGNYDNKPGSYAKTRQLTNDDHLKDELKY